MNVPGSKWIRFGVPKTIRCFDDNSAQKTGNSSSLQHLEIEKNGERVDIAHQWALSLHKWGGATSGIVAAHSLCYHSNKNPQNLPFSDPDPYQAGGLARKKYV